MIVFASSQTAHALVAGIPAAARAAHHAAHDGRITACDVLVPGGWTPDALCHAEFARLVPGLAIRGVGNRERTYEREVRGEFPDGDAALGPEAALAQWDRAVLAATAKPTDGIVSRHINRPVSRAVSRRLLRVPWVRPIHATYVNMALAVAMTACLLLGGAWGAIAGALLFQAASMFDGVDGEIARATFRTSARGATLDSLTDAATNFAFIGGLAANLWLRGLESAAYAGLAGLVMLMLGTALLGLTARRSGKGVNFDAVKARFLARGTLAAKVVTWITMRDFIAAAAVVLVLAGLAAAALWTFAAIVAAWLVVVLATLARGFATR
ncbi:hypothetical protein B2G71_05750 [Novosphingobium sp. PC22D]|nr:hypothetical protein B2G71_05750 [Novosphingobium sp. PC22D]